MTKATADRSTETLGFRDSGSSSLIFSTQVPLVADITSKTTAANGLNAGRTDDLLALWDMQTGKKQWEVPATTGDVGGLHHGGFDIIAVTSDRVLVRQAVEDPTRPGSYSGKLQSYSTKDGAVQWTSPFDLSAEKLKVSDSGAYLAYTSVEVHDSGASTYFVALVDTSTGAVLARKDDSRPDVITWAGPTSILLGSGGDAGDVDIVAADQRLRPVGVGVLRKVKSLMLSEDGSTVYIVDGTEVLRAFNTSAGTEKWHVPLQRSFIMIAARNGKLIANLSDGSDVSQNQIVVLDGATGTQLKVIPGYLNPERTSSRNGHFLSGVGYRGESFLTAWLVLTGTPLGPSSTESQTPPLQVASG